MREVAEQWPLPPRTDRPDPGTRPAPLQVADGPIATRLAALLDIFDLLPASATRELSDFPLLVAGRVHYRFDGGGTFDAAVQLLKRPLAWEPLLAQTVSVADRLRSRARDPQPERVSPDHPRATQRHGRARGRRRAGGVARRVDGRSNGRRRAGSLGELAARGTRSRCIRCSPSERRSSGSFRRARCRGMAYPRVSPLTDQLVYRKLTDDGFAGTHLGDALAARHVQP
jgi:hypothetical protein